MPTEQTRRRFLASTAVASVAGLIRTSPVLAAESRLETTTVRLVRDPTIYLAPQYIAEELLHADGITDIRYIEAASDAETSAILAQGGADFSMDFASLYIVAIDSGAPITLLAGIHTGCVELLANNPIQRITDLKGKSVGVQGLGSTPQIFLNSMALAIGLDPVRDIRWVSDPAQRSLELFAAGKLDAFLGTPPEPQQLRARGIGHVLVNSAVDRPWSQYFCCMLAGHSDFVREHPVATKRVLRAILKGADLCVSEPARIARTLVDRGFTDDYAVALQTLRDVPYDKWREYDAEDTLRFYALRLHEAGMIKSTPAKIISKGADWRFLNQLKRELKA